MKTSSREMMIERRFTVRRRSVNRRIGWRQRVGDARYGNTFENGLSLSGTLSVHSGS